MFNIFSYPFVRVTLYAVIVALVLAFRFPSFHDNKKMQNLKKTPNSVKVTLFSPVKTEVKRKIKRKKIKKKIKRKKKKPKQKKKIKKVLKPKVPVKAVVPDKNITKTIEKKIETVETISKEVVQSKEPVKTQEPQVKEPEIVKISSAQQEKIKLYEEYVYNTIKSEKRYPTKARRMRQQGSVRVRFLIDKYGEILEHKIIKSSGYRTLDRATNKLFERIGKFEVPPEKLETPFEFSIELVYRLK